jgi:hypothetical protein
MTSCLGKILLRVSFDEAEDPAIDGVIDPVIMDDALDWMIELPVRAGDWMPYTR